MVNVKLVALQSELSDLKAELKAERATNEKGAEILAYSERLKAERDAVIAELLDVKAERDILKGGRQSPLASHGRTLSEGHCDCCTAAQTNLADLCEAAEETLAAPTLKDGSQDALLDGLEEAKRRRSNLRDVLARVRPKRAN